MVLPITNVEIFVWTVTAAVTVEERTGVGWVIKKTRGTAVFHQETISVSKIVITMLTARQEYYYPGTNHAMITTVLAVQSSTKTTANMTASLELTRSNKMIQTLISTRTYKTALIFMVTQV